MACANLNSTTLANCEKPGTLACKACRLVTYCSAQCQKDHWSKHKGTCRSILLKETWQPAWVLENRTPAFVRDTPNSLYGTQKYLWGNVPAIDIVQLAGNEGAKFRGPLNLLFAASGDLRNVIQTVGRLPQRYKGAVNIVINDKDVAVMARNAVLLLLFLTVDDAETAAEHALHVFYSAFITQACYDVLQTKIRPLVEAVLDGMAGRTSTERVEQTWTFADRSLRLVLTAETWRRLRTVLTVPAGLTQATAQKTRHAVVLAPGRVDYRDRYLVLQMPAHRMSVSQFWTDGLVLPFSNAREAFRVPNPTIFQNETVWPMMDSANPLHGWDFNAVLQTDTGPAIHDLYGILHHHVKETFVQFHRQVRARPAAFELYCVDARELPSLVSGQVFARIEVSNICDDFYLGVDKTLQTFSPMLQPPAENRHATLILLFLNAVKKASMWSSFEDNLTQDLQRIVRLIGVKPTDPNSADMFRLTSARERVRDVEQLFGRYMLANNFPRAAEEARLVMKKRHTIVDKWPMRVQTSTPPTAGDKKAFQRLMASGHTGQETYVEWKRASS